MIKINLLAQRKTKRADKGQKTLMLGVLAILVTGALVFFLVHQPLTQEVDKLAKTNSKLRTQNARMKDKLKGFSKLKAAVDSLNKRMEAIAMLESARAVPADMLYELSKLLTPNRLPTMTAEMAKRVESDPHRKLAPEWDPKHIWLTQLTEKGGRFKLIGGAQSDGDATQFAKRLEASAYFKDVIPEGGTQKSDATAGVSYYVFTITGRVVY
jgi:Tfp pilus assembly protein PilN